MNLKDIPTVQDIDSWHDSGDVGTMYIACQTMAEELRKIKSLPPINWQHKRDLLLATLKETKQDEYEMLIASLVTALELDREEIERSGRPLGDEIVSAINHILDNHERLSSL